MRDVVRGLRFPEGPVAMDDGSVILTEIAAGRLTRVHPDSGKTEVVAETGGGPNGLAVGPDGALYVCNNGGCFNWIDLGEMILPGPGPDVGYWGHGSIQRVDPSTGEVTTLYTECDGRPLRAPNDLVFDAEGGFWFTDHGVRDEHARASDITAIYYAKPDGSSITEFAYGLHMPNGIGLSPAGDRLYAAETFAGRVWAWDVPEPGVVEGRGIPLAPGSAELLAGLPGLQLLDSLAVDGDGWVNVATIANGGITSISPDGVIVEHTPTPDFLTTNLCFGGDDLRTAYITCSSSGVLYATGWDRPGLRLAFTA